MISSVRLDGTTACITIEGATNAEVFRVYVQHICQRPPRFDPLSPV